MPSNKYSAAIMEESNNMTATAAVNGDTPPAEGLSENDSGVELTNENSPLTAAEPPSPFSPKQNGDAASPQDGNQCSRGSRKRSRKRREDEESTWDSDKSSGASQLGLRQTPRPRTIFQAGLTPHTHGKPRRQNRKQEHGTSPVNTRRAGSRAAREGAAIRNIKLHVSVHAAGTLTAGRGSSTLNNNVTTQGSARPRPSADTHPSTSGWGRGGQPRPSQPRLDKEVLVFHREL